MRADIFDDRKSIHVKLKKEVHFALRAKLFKHNISMQELFDEFAKSVALDTPRGQYYIDSIVSRKLKEVLGEKTKKEKINKIDNDALYSMINGSDHEV